MPDVTHNPPQTESGGPQAADKLLPLVYDELRKLAAAKLVHEHPGHTLQATALVHEVYLRLMDCPSYALVSRGHFLAAAAEAMRRILVDSARRKKRQRRGGDRQRRELGDAPDTVGLDPAVILTVDESLEQLTAEDATTAAVVRLRFFAGLSFDEIAAALGISRATAYRHWAYARAWLKLRLPDEDGKED
jgi:RNA polymerase sigma factor (TIGR02999 family)